MRAMKKVLIAGAVVVVLGAVVWASLRGRDGEKGVEVDIAAAEQADISRLVKASGEVDPRLKVNLSAHVVGKIEKLHVVEGQRVEAGDPVLEMEREAFAAAAEDWDARLRRARLDVEQAELDLADARLKLSRSQRLADEGIVPAETLEASRLQTTAAELRLQQGREAIRQAAANLAKARDDLHKTTVYSPLSGRVIALNAEVGETVYPATMNNPASVVATIADLSEVLARVDVDETEVVHVVRGQEAGLEVDALPDRTYHGRVVEVGSSGYSRPDQPGVTFFEVEALFLDPDPALLPGMSVRAEIVTAAHPRAVVVPIQAVVDRPPLDGGEGDDEISVVFVVEEGVARQRPVETGISDETRVEITAGLEVGVPVVTGPYRQLRDLEDGDAVRPAEDEDEEDGEGVEGEGDGAGRDDDDSTEG